MTTKATEQDLITKLADARELMEALIIDCGPAHPMRAATERRINALKAQLATVNAK